ncbi:hypothetical protein ACFC1I_20975 [Microbacterium sp. NPDC056044]|uniref:hypothetical protein n=1 Tax=Microbacterium sp. NPDC056044 TaxID=3345690 RepID=UPI0035D6E3B4
MPSPLLVSFEQRLADLESNFIVRRTDYNLYSPADFLDALAYRLLASAALEHYVEQRCLEIGASGADRLARSQPSSTGRSLVIWARFQDRRQPRPVHIHELDAISDLGEGATSYALYVSHVRRNHGISGNDLRALALPLGIRESQLPVILTTLLDDLADKRNPASHTVVRSRSEPESEVKLLNQILTPLRQLDDDLQTVCDSFPTFGI